MERTYLLSPNLTTHPDDFPAIGTIIADPFVPLKPLSVAPSKAETSTHNTTLELETSRDFAADVDIWAQALQTVNLNFGGGANNKASTKYGVESLDTVSLKHHPTDEEATQRAKDPQVHATMRASIVRRSPVYMITGLKIARGVSRTITVSKGQHGDAAVSVPVSDQVSAGAKAHMAAETGYLQATHASTDPENDIVFAYQLHVIVEKGRKNKKISIDRYAPKAAMLHHDEKEEGVEERYEASPATIQDLRAFAEESEDVLQESKATDGSDLVQCVPVSGFW